MPYDRSPSHRSGWVSSAGPKADPGQTAAVIAARAAQAGREHRAGEGRGGGAGRKKGEQPHPDQRRRAAHDGRAANPRRRDGAANEHRLEHEREGDPEQDAERVGVRAEVRPCEVAARRDDHAHPEGGCGGEPEHGGHAGPPARNQEQKGKDEGPQEVELLLDGERPEVAEQLGRRGREISAAARDRDPVVDEGGRPENLLAQPHEHIAAQEPCGRRADRDHRAECRQQSACAPLPERAEGDAPGRGRLAQQQVRDQEAAENEENVHADEPAAHPRLREQVVDHDESDGDRAHAVETRVTGLSGGGGLRGHHIHRRQRPV
jgi:hypothetical protein